MDLINYGCRAFRQPCTADDTKEERMCAASSILWESSEKTVFAQTATDRQKTFRLPITFSI